MKRVAATVVLTALVAVGLVWQFNSVMPGWVVARIPPAGLAGCAHGWLDSQTAERCYLDRITKTFDEKGVRGVAVVERHAERDPRLAEQCHSLMHEVVPAWARSNRVSVENLQDKIPASDSERCAAGFVHGVLIALGQGRESPERVAEKAAATCVELTPRSQSINCIHGIGHIAMLSRRDQDAEAALAICRQAVPRDIADCAAGLFHQWLITETRTTETLPKERDQHLRAVCMRVSEDVAVGCWRRWLQVNEPRRKRPLSDLEATCAKELQGAGLPCITAFAYLSRDEPGAAAECAGLRTDDLATACFRGVIGYWEEASERLEQCSKLTQRRAACIRSYSYMFALTDPKRALARCATYESTERDACEQGVASRDQPLGVR